MELSKIARDLVAAMATAKQEEQDLRDRLAAVTEQRQHLGRQRLKFLVAHRFLFSSQEMAEMFGIAPDTVRDQLKKEMTRLGMGVLK